MNIQEIIQKQYCLGCGLCVAVAGTDKLKMKEDVNGFLVPSRIGNYDGAVPGLKNFCPGITVHLQKKLKNKEEKIYGPFISIKTAYAKNESVRHRASSGGAITAILCGLLEKNIVSGVLQVGPSNNLPTKTKYFFSTTVDQVISNAGSRYAPSSLFVDIKSILEQNDRIAVVGKPCDIVGVSQFLKRYPEYQKKVYCTLSFMCMGLPSQNATNKLIQSLGVDDLDKVRTLNYRGNGWPGQATVITDSDEVFTCSYEDSWGKILGRDLLFRCKICPDGWGSFADISSGDAWFTDGTEPLFHDEPGRSFLVIRSSKGVELLANVSDTVAIENYNIAELPVIQKSQHARKERVWAAYLALKVLGDRLLSFKGTGMWDMAFRCSSYRVFRATLGFIKRIPG